MLSQIRRLLAAIALLAVVFWIRSLWWVDVASMGHLDLFARKHYLAISNYADGDPVFQLAHHRADSLRHSLDLTPTLTEGIDESGLSIPYWLILVLAAPLPLYDLVLWRRSHRTRGRGFAVMPADSGQSP